jgi:RNA polymerase sigma factor (TIGR02999 family)
MADAVQRTVTRLLAEMQGGSDAAFDELFPLLYDELRVLAHLQRRRWQGNYTLDTAALVHEAYLKLVAGQTLHVSEREQFLAVAARTMRHILCNYARDRARQKRGGGATPVTLDDAALPAPRIEFDQEQADRLTALGDVLAELERLDARQAQVVDCRFFGGMSIPGTALALGVSEATVKRDWAVARAWLYRALQERAEAQ